MARRARRRNPGFGDTLFQVLVGVVTAVIATIAIDKMREAQENRPLTRREPQGWDTT